MARTNESDLRLNELFGSKAFKIPNYQRGYAWGERQWNDLWEDIWDIEVDNVTGEYRRHYTGTIALQEINRSNVPQEELWFVDEGDRFFDVVDGQQRLTTIVILLHELIKVYPITEERSALMKRYIYRKKESAETKLYLFSYKKEDKNRQFLLNKIFEDVSEILPNDHVNVYTNNLLLAKNWFKDKINALSDEEKKDLLIRLQTALAFDTKYITDNLSVQAVFETMNNRGKPLTILEKLKNRLLFLAAKLPNDHVDILLLSKKINDAWRIIYDCLGKNPNNMLDEDEFLSAHLTLIRKPTDYVFSEQVAEKKVFEMFCNRSTNYLLDYSRSQGDDPVHETKVDYEKIENYVLDIAAFVPYWCEVVNSDDVRIKKLLLQNSSKEMRLLLAELLMFKASSEEVSLADSCIDLLLKIGFRNSILGLNVLDERTYASRARELHQHEITLSELCLDFQTKLEMPCNVDAMIGQFDYLFEYLRGNKGFHRWGGLKFFLMEYECYLKEQKGDFEHVSWDNFNEINIEHIMPQSYEANWKKEMEDYLGEKVLTEDERNRAQKIIINSLGNLTILKDAKNSALQNDSWNKKQGRYETGSFSEQEISKESHWEKKSIWERGCKMLDFMAKMVDGLNFSEEQKKKLLFVSDKYFIEEEPSKEQKTI